ncbi:MAG: 6-phosphogluconolactonase, partial [Rhodobacter sp.]|nr:6-phosphogluconolactonase [Rhodobacter sp.]
MKLIEYPDRDMMMIDVANDLAGRLNEYLMVNDTASFAVPGGTTPGPMFDVLCAADLDWSRVTVFLTDERWVPESDANSNARLVRERLLVERAAAASFVPYHRANSTPAGCVDGLTAALAPHLPISVLLLGMGADMHTASLFPGAEGLDVAMRPDAPGFVPMQAPGGGVRISLSAPVLDGAMSKHLLITGAEKRAALEQAQSLADPMQAPIFAVLDGTTIHWA